MDPRTFLKPRRRPPLERSPDIGETRALPVHPDGRPVLLVFLRHVGCPFAEKTMRDLGEFAGSHPDIRCIAVSHGAPDQTQRWCAAVKASDTVEVLDDPDREIYATWGVGLTPLTHWLGRGSLSGVAKLSREGIRNRHPSGTRWQSAAAFAIDSDGRVASCHIPDHAGDLPDFESLVRTITTD